MGTFVAFWLHSDEAEQLAVAGGEPPTNLHVTLCYLGDVPEQTVRLASRIIEQIAATRGPIEARIGGVATFDEECQVYLLDSAALTGFRAELVVALDAHGIVVDDTHGFTPHITIMYDGAEIPAPALGTVTLDTIGVEDETISLGVHVDKDTGLTADQVDARRAVEDRKKRPRGPTEEQEEAARLLGHSQAPPPKPEDHPAATRLRLRVRAVQKTHDGVILRLETADGVYCGQTSVTTVPVAKGRTVIVDAYAMEPTSEGGFGWDRADVVDRAASPPISSSLRKDAPASGPTPNTVHVDAPLPNISQGYTKKKRKKGEAEEEDVAFVKADTMKQLVYGIVLEPNVEDTQGDIASADDIEACAHGYLADAVLGLNLVHRIQHRLDAGVRKDTAKLVPVESFIAPADFRYESGELVRKGTWVLVAKVIDPNLWQDVLDEKFTGWSMGGTGQRTPLN